jgi:putative nucleotidyltransferase with HDIG domain
MDTPEDYKKMLAYAGTEFYPDGEECTELLIIAGTPERVIRHGRVVAKVAAAIADILTESGVAIDRNLLSSACLLHDIAKGKKNHEARGARMLRKPGYVKVARIVASHKDLPIRRKIGEAEILYIADKITDGTVVSTLENRMLRMESRFPTGSEALINARRRIAAATAVQKKIEAVTGMGLEKIIGGAYVD